MTSPSEVQRLLKLAAEIRSWAEPPMSGSRLDELLELAAKEVERLAREVPQVTAALAELLRLKDLKERIEAITEAENEADDGMHQRNMRDEYNEKRGPAWDAARRALAEYERGART